jgi:hypothetical protein
VKKRTAVLLCAALCALGLPTGAATARREVPVRFGWPASYSPLDLNTGWLPFPASPVMQQFRGYMRANAVPYAFIACGKLVFSFDDAQVYPGNTFQCSVWLEPYDSPDLTEIRSDFGCEFGVEIRDRWTGINLSSFSKDFLFAIEGNGGLPLGASMIGGCDTIEYMSIPVDEFLPESAVVDLVQGALDVLDANGASTGIGEVEILGELVVHGNRINMRVGETDIELTGAGPANAKTAFINVPIDAGSGDSYELPVAPLYNFTLYKGMGLKLTAFGPLSLTLGNERIIPNPYQPPSESVLDSNYQRAVDGATVTCDDYLSVLFPIKDRPLVPDLAIHDIVVNPSEPATHGKAYVNETTTIAFTLSNVGGLTTLATDELVVKFFVGGTMVQQQVLNNKGGMPSLILDTNQSVRLTFQHLFSVEGTYDVELRSGHSMLKGYSGGQPVYGLGDPFFANHMKRIQIYAAPARGTVIGRVFSNPTGPGEGINGITVRLNGIYRSLVCTSAYESASACNGMYRFNAVPSGDYLLEMLPPPPTNTVGPRYWPRSIRFAHAGDGTTDLTEGSGLYMRQYQRLHGSVWTKDFPPDGKAVTNVVVRFCGSALLETRTGAGNEFVLTNVPPAGTFKLTFEHPDYLVKEVIVEMRVDFTDQTDTYITKYYELPGMVPVDSGYFVLVSDKTAPRIELEPFDNDGRRTTPLSFAFSGSDQNGRFTPSNYCWQVHSTTGVLLAQSPWITWPADVAPNQRTNTTADLSSLADGTYRFSLGARDRAGNIATTAYQTFTLDKTPPQVAVVVAGGAAVTASRLVPVAVTLANAEPGTLKLELSNDGVTWSAPWTFTGAVFTVSNWEVSGRETANGTATVWARVTDAAGLQGGASDGVTLATVGAVELAYGLEAYTNTAVPLEIGIIPPDGQLQERLATYAYTLDVGGGTNNRYRAQAFVLPTSITFNRIRLCYSDTIGEPGPLTVRVVPALSNADPSGAASAVWSWSITADELRNKAFLYNGLVPAQSGAGTVLPAGTHYVIFGCESTSAGDRYVFRAGNHLYNGDGGLRYDYSNSVWVAAIEAAPGVGVQTFAFDLWNSPNGEIRICTDGTPDTEPWTAFPFPDDPFRKVTAPGQGLFTVIVGYSNAVDVSRNGTHMDSVMIDMTPPVVNAVTLLTTDKTARGVLMDLDVSDAHTRVAAMKWRFDGGAWQGDAFRRKPFLFCPPSFANMSWVFIDAAGNESAPVVRTFAVDMSAPTLSATVEGGALYTRNVELAWTFAAWDDTKLDRISVREARSGTNYPPINPRTEQTVLILPKCMVKDADGKVSYDWIDGAYCFEATAYDKSSNVSAAVILPLTLDRLSPVLDSAVLTGAAGESPVTGTNLLLKVSATDAIGPMRMRWRWKYGAWSEWFTMSGGQAGLALTGYVPQPLRYDVDVEVSDAAGNAAAAASCGVAVNREPATPTGIRPHYGTGSPPLLFGSDFVDPDGDAWHASQFTVRDRTTTRLDTGALYGADRYIVPRDLVTFGTKYQWRCRYLDEHGAWSGWSGWLAFECQSDLDGDGIPDGIENGSGTNPESDDSDGDGVPDGMEDINANGVVDPGESDPRLADSDGDGLSDKEEDGDGDARLDPAETSPALADTDSDTASDWHERAAGTNPRDSASFFHVTTVTNLADGRCRLTWQAHGGSTYAVMADTDLADGVAPTVVTNLTASGGAPPWYVVPMTWTEPSNSPPKRFYFIRTP